jgi:hypothetical protein
MSARTIRRTHERALRRDARRRARLSGRAAVATGAAVGAAALFAPAAEAANLTVTSLADDGSGGLTLREAVEAANLTADDDVVLFQTGLSGEITLTGGQLEVNTDQSGPNEAGNLTISGPAAGQITVSGDGNDNDVSDAGDSRIIHQGFSLDSGVLSVSGLTLAEGYAGVAYEPGYYICDYYDYYTGYCLSGYTTPGYTVGTDGGAISTRNGSLTLSGVVLTDNLATDDAGALAVGGDALTIDDSTIDGNVAYHSAGGVQSSADDVTISGTSISGNATTGFDVSYGGSRSTRNAGAYLDTDGSISITDSSVEDNFSTTPEGSYGSALSIYSYYGEADIGITDTSISNNDDGGGLDADTGRDGTATLLRTTISGNHAANGTAGAIVENATISQSRIENNASLAGGTGGLRVRGASTISQTTIAGNSGSIGGVLTSDFDDAAALDPANVVEIANSTISGNSAHEFTDYGNTYGGVGGGVYARGENGVSIRNTTVSGNSAEVEGGGVYSYSDEDYHYSSPYGEEHITYADRRISSSIIANNTAGGAPNDLATGGAQGDTVGFVAEFSLIETHPGGSLAAIQSITGVDPQLGPLANNGGPTRTLMPAPTSPAIDQGTANGLALDQRGQNRTVDLGPANAADGTDIGSVEATATSQPPPDEEVEGSTTVDNTQKLKKKLKLKIDVACEEACTASSDGTVSVGGGGKGRILFKAKKYKLKEDSANLAAGESETLVLKLDGSKKKVKKATKKIKKAIKKGKKVKANVTTVITDGAGNSESQTDKIKIT